MTHDTILNLDCERKISAAGYITFINGTPHPDRILQEHDFLYMIDGNWEIYQDGVPYYITNGDLLLLPAGRHHYGITPCSPHNRHMYIHNIPDAKDSLFPSLDSAQPCFHPIIHCQSNPQISRLFEEVIAAFWHDSAIREKRLSILFRLMLCDLLEQQERQPCLSGKLSPVFEIIRLLQANPQRFYRASELSEQFYLCERTLNHRFREFCGKTFYTYQMDAKLELVRQFLISQPHVTLHETALNFGFYDEFHLSKTFRKKYGLSPKQYRQRNFT